MKKIKIQTASEQKEEKTREQIDKINGKIEQKMKKTKTIQDKKEKKGGKRRY